MEFSFSGELKVWEGQGAWYYVVLPADYSEPIKQSQPTRRGFGAVKVKPTIGGTVWETSIFPDNERGAYLLFIKRQVREAENIELGDMCTVVLTVL